MNLFSNSYLNICQGHPAIVGRPLCFVSKLSSWAIF